MLAFILAIGTAWSEPVQQGIPTEGVEGLSRPIYQTSSTGWWSQIPRGTVQIYVGENEEEATLWVETMKEKMAKYRPEPNEAFLVTTNTAMAYGDGIGLLIVRNQNLAFMVRHDGEAESWARTLHEATVEIPDPPLAPAVLAKEDNLWAEEQQLFNELVEVMAMEEKADLAEKEAAALERTAELLKERFGPSALSCKAVTYVASTHKETWTEVEQPKDVRDGGLDKERQVGGRLLKSLDMSLWDGGYSKAQFLL